MSRRRTYHQDTINTMQRFFSALDDLYENGKLQGGIKGFCTANNIDRRHLYTQKEDIGRGFFEVQWLVPLIKDYRVSPVWLLMGSGPMYI